jgi:hypothetical protein
MNNFFLLNETLNTETIVEFELGISNINAILLSRNSKNDTFIKHRSIWQHHNGHGIITEFFYSVVNKETQRLIPAVFKTFKDCPIYINNETDFDILFENSCNAFVGMTFSNTAIPAKRQIINKNDFNSYKNDCELEHAYDSINDFWNNREVLFPSLKFCDRVFDQIQHLSVTDNRFKLINEKLRKLNLFTAHWNEGSFDFKSIGMDCSPDTPTRVANTLSLRTFPCPEIGDRVFNYHIKWSFGKEPFRMYFFPEVSNRKVYIGYIGPKDEIGF